MLDNILILLKEWLVNLKNKLTTNEMIDDEILKKYHELLQLEHDLEKRIQVNENSLIDKIYLFKLLCNNQTCFEKVWSRRKRNKVIECYNTISEFSQLCNEYNDLYSELEKTAISHAGRIPIDYIRDKWDPKKMSSHDRINQVFEPCKKKLKVVQLNLDETLKYLRSYLKI